jgi:hypothetical protein
MSCEISNILQTEHGYLLVGTQNHGTIFLSEIDSAGKILWLKRLFSSPDAKKISVEQLKNSYIVSFRAFKIDFIAGTKKEYGYTFEVDKKEHRIVSKEKLTLSAIVAYKKGYISADYNGLITCVDQNRNLIWKLHPFNDNRHVVTNFIETKSKNILAIGYDNYSFPMFLVEFNHDGKIIWKRAYKFLNLIPFSIAKTDKYYYVVGRVRDTTYWRHLNVWKFDHSGELVLQKRYNDRRASEAYTIINSMKGALLVGGFVDKYPWIIKIDENAEPIFDKIIMHSSSTKFSSTHVINKILKTKDGGYLLSVDTKKDGVWLIKTDKNFRNIPSIFQIQSILKRGV